MVEHYDFCGYATKNDVLCNDGRTIRKDAFKDCDGMTVPLVWNHIHNDPDMVLGHAILENRDDGVFMYGKFNDTEKAQNCKKILDNRDIMGLSIYANGLKQKGGNVLHGAIKEVSLVLAGANPGALIDFSFAHGDEADDEMWAYLVGDEYTNLQHGDITVDETEDETVEEEPEAKEENDEQPVEEGPEPEPEKENEEMYDEEMMHADEEPKEKENSKSNSDETVEDVFNTLTDKQKTAVYALIAAAAGEDNDEDEEDEDVKHNAFESNYETEDNFLSHADIEEIFRDAKKIGSLKEAVQQHQENGVLAHADSDYNITRGTGTNEYFVRDPEMLFPDYKGFQATPEFIKRDTTWVTDFMSRVKHSPFSRVKTMFADITIDEARALGYVKGNLKREEYFNLIKRTTDPQTIYKKQKMDRDDVIDITDFDVVAWIKGEMRDMLEEEIARACLVGDGRSSESDDKIYENHIRPIVFDHEMFTIKSVVTNSDSTSALAKNFVKNCIFSRKDYKGSGNPVLYITDTMLAYLLTMEDGNGRFIYETEAHLMTALRVSKIVTVPVMENVKVDGNTLAAVIVNPIDYVIGADKGGAVNMFDDFDLDYNKMIYLIETRISGALVKPKSAIVLTIGDAEEEEVNP